MSKEQSIKKHPARSFKNKKDLGLLGIKAITLVLWVLLYCAMPAAAQNRDTVYNQLDSVLVTSRNIKTSQAKTPYVISSIDQNQIRETNARTTPEALQGVAGVFLQKTNHGGGSAFIRDLRAIKRF